MRKGKIAEVIAGGQGTPTAAERLLGLAWGSGRRVIGSAESSRHPPQTSTGCCPGSIARSP